MAVDFATGNVWFAKNNTWLNSSDPVVETVPMMTFTPATVGALFPAMTLENNPGVWTLQSTAAALKYAPPSGFKAWDAP